LLSRAQQDNWSRSPPEHLVVGLCAAWCGTCREFQDTFEALQKRHPERSFVWLDVEDDAAIAGDIDVENFPSLVVFNRGTPVFFGVTEPQQGVIERLIEALDDAPKASVPKEVSALYQALVNRS
jgi:thioredoxin reductase (NADPH)